MSEILDENIPEEKPLYRFRYGTCIFWLFISLIGYLFRIMHWPFQFEFIMSGASGFIAYNLFFAVKFKGKNIPNNIFVLLSFFWIMYLLAGYFFNPKHSYNLKALTVHFIAIVAFYILYTIFKQPIKKTKA